MRRNSTNTIASTTNQLSEAREPDFYETIEHGSKKQV